MLNFSKFPIVVLFLSFVGKAKIYAKVILHIGCSHWSDIRF